MHKGLLYVSFVSFFLMGCGFLGVPDDELAETFIPIRLNVQIDLEEKFANPDLLMYYDASDISIAIPLNNMFTFTSLPMSIVLTNKDNNYLLDTVVTNRREKQSQIKIYSFLRINDTNDYFEWLTTTITPLKNYWGCIYPDTLYSSKTYVLKYNNYAKIDYVSNNIFTIQTNFTQTSPSNLSTNFIVSKRSILQVSYDIKSDSNVILLLDYYSDSGTSQVQTTISLPPVSGKGVWVITNANASIVNPVLYRRIAEIQTSIPIDAR